MNKIDIRDLRNGNWVHCITDNVNHRIDSFGTDDRIEVYGNPWYIYDGKINVLSDIEPITLTKEILEKNGFKYKEFPEFAVNEITKKTKVAITYHSGSKTIFIGISNPNFNLTSSLVLYVHEMQNLLRDARIKKEIAI